MEPSHKTPGQGAAYPAGRWGWGPDALGQRTIQDLILTSQKDSAFSCLEIVSEFLPNLSSSFPVLVFFCFIHLYSD